MESHTLNNRMPNGGISEAATNMVDRGVNVGVTDTYGANLSQGYDKISETGPVSPETARMEGDTREPQN